MKGLHNQGLANLSLGGKTSIPFDKDMTYCVQVEIKGW